MPKMRVRKLVSLLKDKVFLVKAFLILFGFLIILSIFNSQNFLNNKSVTFDPNSIIQVSSLSDKKIVHLFTETGERQVLLTDRKMSKNTAVKLIPNPKLNIENYDNIIADSKSTTDYILLHLSLSQDSKKTLAVFNNKGKMLTPDLLALARTTINKQATEISYTVSWWSSQDEVVLDVFTRDGKAFRFSQNLKEEKIVFGPSELTLNDVKDDFGASFQFPEGWKFSVAIYPKQSYTVLSFSKGENKITVHKNVRGFDLEADSSVTYIGEEVLISGKTASKRTLAGKPVKSSFISVCSNKPNPDCYTIDFRAAEDLNNNSEALAAFNELISTFKLDE